MAGQIKHYWVGTTLFIESDSGTSSCDLVGPTGVTGARGPQGVPGRTGDAGVGLPGEQGPQGEPGNKIIGVFNSYEELVAAYPTGQYGQAFAVKDGEGSICYVWADGWQSVGSLTMGEQGVPGASPYIGSNGNWWVADTDLGVAAQGPQGEQGLPGGVTSINGMTGDVTIETADTNAYTPTNPPPYPVTKVNNKTGAVSLTYSDVNAASSSHNHDSTYLKLAGGTVSGATTFSSTVTAPVIKGNAIIYSTTQPTGTTVGQLWLKPV